MIISPHYYLLIISVFYYNISVFYSSLSDSPVTGDPLTCITLITCWQLHDWKLSLLSVCVFLFCFILFIVSVSVCHCISLYVTVSGNYHQPPQARNLFFFYCFLSLSTKTKTTHKLIYFSSAVSVHSSHIRILIIILLVIVIKILMDVIVSDDSLINKHSDWNHILRVYAEKNTRKKIWNCLFCELRGRLRTRNWKETKTRRERRK